MASGIVYFPIPLLFCIILIYYTASVLVPLVLFVVFICRLLSGGYNLFVILMFIINAW